MLLPVIVAETRNSCGTRPWSAGGGCGELSHHALDDRHEGGTKSGPMGTVRFSRVVPSLLVSALHFRSAPWAFARGCARFDPKFFLHMVEHRAFKGVDRLKGKFRSFLLASFQNHLSDAADRARRLKRGGDKNFVQLDAEDAEKRYRLEPVDFLTAEKIFDARWAMTVLGEALKKLSQEYVVGGKASTFETLKVFLDTNNSRTPPSYDEVASRLQVTTGAVKTHIHRLRKRYTALLREEVGCTVSDPAEIDEEIHALCEALIATEGRLGP
jgi:hypothetical protein